MKPILTVLFLLSLFSLSACVNTPSQTANNQKNGANPPTEIGGPDTKDLASALQGVWRNLEDSTYLLEIADAKMKHLNGGALSAETEIEIDAKCKSSACAVDSSLAIVDGWCFIEKGPFDAQCNLVLKCDKNELHYTAIGSTGKTMMFLRIN
jgi:hypothetical protein